MSTPAITPVSPALPEWEVQAQRSASAETVRDPDWIAAHLREALASDYQKSRIELLLGDVSLWTADADEQCAAITDRPSLPRVAWSRRFGYCTRLPGRNGISQLMPHLSALISDWEHDNITVVAQSWATALRLREDPDPMSGTRSWDGAHEGWYVRVWIITDRAMFDAA